MPVKNDLSETFERNKFDGKTVKKGKFNNIVTRLCKLQSHNLFDFIFYFCLFCTYNKATDQPHANGIPNPAFIREKKLKPTSNPVKFVDALYPVYKRKYGGRQNTPSLISSEDLVKWSNEKLLIWGWVILAIPILCHSRWMNLSIICVCTIGIV